VTNSLNFALRDLPDGDGDAAAVVAERAAQVLRPSGALARLDEIAVWLAAWQRRTQPSVTRPHCLVFGGDHGVTTSGVSAYPAEVTSAMRDAINQQRATISALGRAAGVAVTLVDVGIGEPTEHFASAPAMSAKRFEATCAAATAAVRRLVEDEVDLLVVGELGIGNTTAAAAVCACLYGGDVAEWVGRGTGVDDDGLARKVAVVEQAQRRLATAGANGGSLDPLDVLREVGGTELVAMAAAVVAARQAHIPVVLDGYVCTAAVAPLHAVRANALDHCLVAHASAEPGHRQLLQRLGKTPLLDLQMRLGEASGAMVAVPIVRMAAAGVVEVPTFAEWFG
jgi:nicotinate-nucleotide--dimethylbenzimidazole phosphoribosyltransferase